MIHLESLYVVDEVVTWAHLGKKWTRLQLYTKIDEEYGSQWLEMASGLQSDGVRKFETASERNRLKEALEDSAKRRHGDLRELSAKEAWKTIENFSQGQKEWDKPFKAITEQELASLRAQENELFGNEKVYTPPVTYLEEVEETIGILMEVEPLDETQLEDLGLNTCNHDIPLSSREVPSFDEPKPQLQPLPICPSLDVSLEDERGPKPLSPDSFRMKVVDSLTIHTPHSPHVVSLHPKDIYCY
ncbi:hypothetical protein Tco_0277224 [Tanacetum coccineum]